MDFQFFAQNLHFRNILLKIREDTTTVQLGGDLCRRATAKPQQTILLDHGNVSAEAGGLIHTQIEVRRAAREKNLTRRDVMCWPRKLLKKPGLLTIDLN
jgi:hypothetical protein